MKKLYEVPTVFLLRIPAHLLSDSGSAVTEGGGSLRLTAVVKALPVTDAPKRTVIHGIVGINDAHILRRDGWVCPLALAVPRPMS